MRHALVGQVAHTRMHTTDHGFQVSIFKLSKDRQDLQLNFTSLRRQDSSRCHCPWSIVNSPYFVSDHVLPSRFFSLPRSLLLPLFLSLSAWCALTFIVSSFLNTSFVFEVSFFLNCLLFLSDLLGPEYIFVFCACLCHRYYCACALSFSCGLQECAEPPLLPRNSCLLCGMGLGFVLCEMVHGCLQKLWLRCLDTPLPLLAAART